MRNKLIPSHFSEGIKTYIIIPKESNLSLVEGYAIDLWDYFQNYDFTPITWVWTRTPNIHDCNNVRCMSSMPYSVNTTDIRCKCGVIFAIKI